VSDATAAVRAATERDLPALIALCVEHARHEGSAFDASGKVVALGRALSGPTPRLHGWVAELASGVVGYATAAAEFSTWGGCEYLHLDCLFVRAEARGHGIGAALLDAVREHARRSGHPRIEWQTPEWNRDAIRFYRREGAIGDRKERFRLDL
jgi:GNAT superfamily N-acetyltransferase